MRVARGVVIGAVVLAGALFWAHSRTDDPATDHTPATESATVSSVTRHPSASTRPTSVEPSGSEAPESAASASPQLSADEAMKFGHAFVSAFARPDPKDEDQWRAMITTRVSDRLRENLTDWNPQMTAWTTTTGPAHVASQAPGEWVVDVPTDAGTVAVTIIVEHDRLLVTAIALERS